MNPSVSDETSPSSARSGLAIVSLVALTLLLVINVPVIMRTGLELDAVLFDLYARDMAQGRILYRDMVENNTPTMIGIHMAVRKVLGPSMEALRAVDLLVVAAGIGMLSWWCRPGRTDLHLFTFTCLSAIYVTTTEWCHVQRDIWLLLPVMVAMSARRWQMNRLMAGQSGFPGAFLEGILWGLAVWLKPHALVVAAAVWVTGSAWVRSRGATTRGILADACGQLLGGLLIGFIGIAIMDALGIWWPYVDHLLHWGGDYRKADMHGELGPTFFWLGYLIRNSPWSVIYLMTLPIALVVMIRPFVVGPRSENPTSPLASDRPDQALLAAALCGWALQANTLQHIFDYPHIPPELLAIALLIDLGAGLSVGSMRRNGLLAIALITLVGHGKLFVQRTRIWTEVISSPDNPKLRDKLARYERVGWQELEDVANFLTTHQVTEGQVNVMSDTALPLWELLNQKPPTRYYIFQNNYLAFRTYREQILETMSQNPEQMYLVCDLVSVKYDPKIGASYHNPDSWPLAYTWYGERRWADRVIFRSGRYVVLAVSAAEFPALIHDLWPQKD